MANAPGFEASGFVELAWIPVGAGTHVQWASLALYEAVASRLARRPAGTLLHAALKIGLDERLYTLEVTPAPAGPNVRAEVTGPVGVRGADRLRLFRYQVCVNERADFPDERWALEPRITVTSEARMAERVLELTARVPNYTWGRRRRGHPEMWTSDSCVAWILAVAGADAEHVAIPAGCRAPGWASGLVEARRARTGGAAALKRIR